MRLEFSPKPQQMTHSNKSLKLHSFDFLMLCCFDLYEDLLHFKMDSYI